MWKAITAILNFGLTASITFHNFLHGFRAGCGKLFQQLAALSEKVLSVIFLDLQKAYVTLDRSRCLEILEEYGVGPQACRLLRKYWSQLMMMMGVGWYYGVAFTGAQGVTQGDPLSPTTFNVMVNAVV